MTALWSIRTLLTVEPGAGGRTRMPSNLAFSTVRWSTSEFDALTRIPTPFAEVEASRTGFPEPRSVSGTEMTTPPWYVPPCAKTVAPAGAFATAYASEHGAGAEQAVPLPSGEAQSAPPSAAEDEPTVSAATASASTTKADKRLGLLEIKVRIDPPWAGRKTCDPRMLRRANRARRESRLAEAA